VLESGDEIMGFEIVFRVGGAAWTLAGISEDRNEAEKKVARLRQRHPDRQYEIHERIGTQYHLDSGSLAEATAPNFNRADKND